MLDGKKDYITYEEAIQFLMHEFKCNHERAEELMERFEKDCPYAIQKVH